jgi:hypothetical protein
MRKYSAVLIEPVPADARSTGHADRFSARKVIGNAAHRPGRPNLLTVGDTVWLAWKEFDGKRISIKKPHSLDASQHWSNERIIGGTLRAADRIVLAAALPSPAQAGSTPFLEADNFAQVRTRYAQKPLIVHIWGLTCGPCLEE